MIKLLKDCQFQHSTLNCINKYRLQTILNTTGDQITMVSDTVMTFIRRRRFAWFEIAPAPRRVHCVRQRCFHFVHFSPEAPHHQRCARQTVLTSANIPDVRVPDCPRSFDGGAEDPLAEPHRNKALGRHDSYLRGIWHLKGIWIEVSTSESVNWGSRILPRLLPSPVTLFHFLLLFSLPSSSSLPSPTGRAHLKPATWNGACNQCEEGWFSYLSTFTDGFLTLQNK